ncbi:MAG: hypothetical protein WC627_03135 [Legionella sp.]|jgi:hypothetical protein
MNPNDKIRAQILQWFYDRNNTATSKYGKKGTAVKISDVKSGLKSEYALTQPQVMSNLTYLLDKGWINKTDIEKTVQLESGTIPSITTWYEISAAGIDKIETISEFKENVKYPGININATGNNIVTLGDGNIVNVQYKSLHDELTNLKNSIAKSTLSETDKLNLSVDIESLNDQLAKSQPDKSIIGSLWSKIETAATVGGFADAIGKISFLISSLLPD